MEKARTEELSRMEESSRRLRWRSRGEKNWLEESRREGLVGGVFNKAWADESSRKLGRRSRGESSDKGVVEKALEAKSLRKRGQADFEDR